MPWISSTIKDFALTSLNVVINGRQDQLEGKNSGALRPLEGPGQKGCRRLVQVTALNILARLAFGGYKLWYTHET